ncbi:unnamed protein product, partial [Natator depressus]
GPPPPGLGPSPDSGQERGAGARGRRGDCRRLPGPAPGEETGTGAVRGRAGRGAELVPAAAAGGRGRRVQLLPGEFAPGEEAMLTLSYTWKLPLEHDGAARHVLPTVLHPRYTPHRWDGENITQEVPRVLQGELPYTLSRSAMLQSPHGIDHVVSNCPLTPLSYTAGNLTTAQGLPDGRPGRDDDPAAQSARGGAGPEPAGKFVLLLGRSGSTACPTDAETCPASASTAPRDGQETLVLLLKSLPLGCYFKIYGFGSEFESFYPQSVENTQQTKAESLQRLQLLQANLGGTEILEPLRAIYRSPCRDEHPPQLFVFTDGEVENTQDIIAEVQHHRGTH